MKKAIKKIPLNDSIDILSAILESNIITKSNSWVIWALDTIIEFYTEYKILRTSKMNDSDGLLFEYGVYPWDAIDNKPQFSITFTRQINISRQDEFHQIRLTLLYDATLFTGIEAYNLWSFDNDLLVWKDKIENTTGFKHAVNKEITTYRLSLNET